MKTKLVLVVFAVAFLAGCNTMEGMGRDIGKAGEKIEEAAKKK